MDKSSHGLGSSMRRPTSTPRGEPPDFVALADRLRALANPARLELLYELRFPRAITDIHLKPSVLSSHHAERNISREGVRKHVNRLVELGFLEPMDVQRDGLPAVEHVLNHRSMFGVVEDLRDVARKGPLVDLPLRQTRTVRTQAPEKENFGPRLIMVHGPRDGYAYSLSAQDSSIVSWVIGRRPGVAVCLDHDPFVSLDHAEVRSAESSDFVVADLKRSKNGTWLNWREMPRGGVATLRTGDVVGVGRTLLLFRED
jgi:FHA domain-containing protein